MSLGGLTLLIGVSGVGKTAVADEIARSRPNFSAFHGGVRLRAAAEKDPTGSISSAMSAGLAVSPGLFLEIIREAVREFDQGTHLLMDGFPRSVEQVGLMPSILEFTGVPRDNVRAILMQSSPGAVASQSARRYECRNCGTVQGQPHVCPNCGAVASLRSRNQLEPVLDVTIARDVRNALSFHLPVHQMATCSGVEATAAAVLDLIEGVSGTECGRDELDTQLDCLIDSFRLHNVRRFFHQRYFDEETREVEYSRRVHPDPHLETVSEHSWHLADAVLLFAPTFPSIDIDRAVQLAIAHDKLEMFTGDIDPIGRDGTGQRAHAFNEYARMRKRERELSALDAYLSRLPMSARTLQESLHREALDCVTPEARFMKSLDKLCAIAFILVKKDGHHSDQHLRLIHQLTERNATYFAGLAAHHWALLDRILIRTAKNRGVPIKAVRAVVDDGQSRLFDLGGP